MHSLRAGDVHLWLGDTDATDLATAAGCLAPADLAYAEQFRNARLRHRALVGRAMRRHVLGGYLGVSPETIEFLTGPWGKPSIDPARLSPDARAVEFSASGSLALAALAVCVGHPVGVDIEVPRAMPDALEIARSQFHPAEVRQLAALDGASLAEAFYRCWTYKEAYLKATGAGLSTELNTFQIPIVAGAAEPGSTRLDVPGPWWITDLSDPPGRYGAVCTLHPRAAITTYWWTAYARST